MGYFPICVELKGRTVMLVGNGPQSDMKLEKLLPFGPRIRRMEILGEEDLTEDVAFVVAGDQDDETAARISRLCGSRGIPVNVVDKPDLCSFYFPALINRGDLTISVSTAGAAPAAAAYLRQQIDGLLPEQTEAILAWLHDLRMHLFEVYPKGLARAVLHEATRLAFSTGQVLSGRQVISIVQGLTEH